MITLTSLRKPGTKEKPPEKKTCLRCKQTKEMKKFRRDTCMKDGRGNVCLECEKNRREELKRERNEFDEQFFDPKTPAF